jgi:hypothetical protein
MRVRSVLRAPATSTMLKDPPAKMKPSAVRFDDRAAGSRVQVAAKPSQ